MNQDPLTFLTRSEKEDIMTFFKYLHDKGRITMLGTSQEYKRVYFMLTDEVSVATCMQKSQKTSMM